MSSEYESHPFSQPGNNDFLYDLYLEGRCPGYPTAAITYDPKGAVIQGDGTTPPPEGRQSLWLVKNVPGYLDIQFDTPTQGTGEKQIEKYLGYAIRLTDYDSAESYFKKQFSSRNRRKLRSKTRKLRHKGDLTHDFYYGPLQWQEHVDHFDTFYRMLKTRFDSIGMYNRNLIHWAYFCRNSYRRIQEKKAFLLVVRLNGEPIAYSLNYLQDKLVFGIFQTHDVAYEAFNLGDICMRHKLEWCFEHQMWLYDFSYGHNYFKEKWSNYQYRMSHYIFYRDSLPGRFKASLKAAFFRFRQKLRDWGILGKLFQYDKFFYRKKAARLSGFDWKKGLTKP